MKSKDLKKRILITLGGLGGGGAERNLINFLNHFNRNLFHIEVLCYYKTGVYVSAIPADVKVHYLTNGEDFLSNSFIKPLQFKLNKKKVKFLRSNPSFLYNSYFQNFDLEIAFLHDIIPFVANSPIQNKIGFLRNDIELEDLKPQKKRQIIQGSRCFQKLIAVSTEAKNGFVKMGGDANKIDIIYNPIDVENIRKRGSDTFDFKNNQVFNILAVGRLFPQKRYDRLIEAVHILKEDNTVPPFQLHILGKGPLRAEIQKQIKSLKLHDMVHLLGYNNNPYKVMNKADIVTLSSDFEGLPGVICEALSLSKPIVATNAAGVGELLQDGELGIIVEKNSKKLAEGLKTMLQSEQLQQSLQNKLSITSFPFDKQVVMPQLEKIYLSI